MSERSATPVREGYSQWFVIVIAVFVTCLITANITAVKLVDFFGFILPAGVIVFPVSYIAGDVLTGQQMLAGPLGAVRVVGVIVTSGLGSGKERVQPMPPFSRLLPIY